MNKFIYLFFFSFLTLFLKSSAQISPDRIVPTPQSVKMAKGTFVFKSPMKVVVNGKSAEVLMFAAKQLSDAIQDPSNFNTKVSIEQSSGREGQIELLEDASLLNDSTVKMLKVKEEAYFISVTPQKISVKAPTAKGVFYGVMSLVQLIEKSSDNKIPCFELFDYPDMKIRGISDDISRGQVSTLDNFKRIIRFMARYKMNMYQPYLEDMLQFKAYPTIGVGRGALSAAEVKELVQYARQYFVDVIPVFETLGHFENILSQPEFARFAEFPGSASLDLSNDSIYVMLENMLKEIFEMFPADTIHMAADESFDVGFGNSKKLIEEKGIARAHADHYKKIYDICQRAHKKVIMYGDIILEHPEILDMIPKDIQVADWDYGDNFNFDHVKKFKDAGFTYVVSPAVWNYTTAFPAYALAIPNIQYFIKAGIDNGADGQVTSQWGDYGAETFRELNLFGFAWSGQCSWNYNASSPSSFSRNFFYDFLGTDDDRVTAMYQTLSNMYGDLLWHDVWQHPMLKFKSGKWMYYNMSAAARTSFADWTMSNSDSTLAAIQAKAKYNKDHIDLLRWLINLDKWYCKKSQIQSMLLDMQANKSVDTLLLLNKIDENKSSLTELHNEYKKLWLRTNTSDNLHYIDDKFNRLAAYYDEIKEQLKNKALKPALIESKWIYYPITEKEFAKKAEFKTEVELKSKPTSAIIQLIGDNYCRLYINDKLVTEVSGTAQLSMKVECGRVKMVDVTSFFKEGTNTISVKAEKFVKNGGTACNVIGKINTSSGEIQISSDNKWKASEDGKTWKDAVTKEWAKQVIAPNFATHRASWIER